MSNPAEELTRRAYDQVADAYADHFPSTEPEAPLDLAVIDHFVTLLAEPRRVLDAGCGAGRMLPYLADRGCVVEGVDLSAEMVRRARADHPGFPIHVGTLTDLALPDASFDGVFSWYSTIHNPDDDLPGILGGLARLLRPGGLLLVGFQTGSGRHEVGAGYRARGHDVELYRYSRTPDEMQSALQRAGLHVVCRMERAAAPGERCGQGVVVAQREPARPTSEGEGR